MVPMTLRAAVARHQLVHAFAEFHGRRPRDAAELDRFAAQLEREREQFEKLPAMLEEAAALARKEGRRSNGAEVRRAAKVIAGYANARRR